MATICGGRIRDQVSRSIPAGAITFFPIKSVPTTCSLKGDISYLHKGKKKEHSGERERERERERECVCVFAKLIRFWLVHFRCIWLWDIDIPREKWLNCFCNSEDPDQMPHSIISIWQFIFCWKRHKTKSPLSLNDDLNGQALLPWSNHQLSRPRSKQCPFLSPVSNEMYLYSLRS